MYLKKIKKLAANQNLVIVGDKKTKLAKTISDHVASFFKDFVKGEKDSDFLKTPECYYFFVKSLDNNEKMRVAGATIRKQ